MKTIVAISGSNRAESINQQLLEYTTKHFADAQITYLSMREVDLPFYSQDLEAEQGLPAPLEAIKFQLMSADGYIIASPEHNGLMPAELKNFLDWLSRAHTKEQPAFGGKPMLLLSASPGENGGSTNLATLARLLPWQGANIVASYSLGRFYQAFEQGTLATQEQVALSAAIHSLSVAVDAS